MHISTKLAFLKRFGSFESQSPNVGSSWGYLQNGWQFVELNYNFLVNNYYFNMMWQKNAYVA
jgi:hypothetical protein